MIEPRVTMRIVLFLLILTVLPGFPVRAQDAPAAAPPKTQHTVSNTPGGLVVLELFSSQACVFCPKADSLFGDFMLVDNVIGFACHVDYFDVQEGSLAKSFCTQRQSYYQSVLHGGPNYTPQLIINGSHDVVGYRLGDISQTIRKVAASDGVMPIKIDRTENDNVFDVTMPSVGTIEKPLEIWVALQDKPHDVTIKEGGNRGEHAVYKNIASALESYGAWEGKAETIRMDLKLTDQHQGFILLAQDQATGRILAAGQYSSPQN
jgi:hypothetical protein